MPDRSSMNVVRGAVRASVVPAAPAARHEDAVAALPVVAISRQAGTGAGEIAQRLAALLNKRANLDPPWRSFDRELVTRVAEQHGVKESVVAAYDERDESVVEAMFHGLSRESSDQAVAIKTAVTVRRLAQAGRVIIVGRGGQSILAGMDHVVHIRLVGPEAWRATQYGRENELADAAALREIRRIDRQRTRFVRAHFNKDPTNHSLYDAILNVARLGPARVAAAIAALLDDYGDSG